MAQPDRKLRVLTVTSNALSGATGIGSTFLNFFGGCGVELASVYTGYGLPQAGACRGSFRITEKSLIKNLKNRSFPSGERVDEDRGTRLTSVNPDPSTPPAKRGRRCCSLQGSSSGARGASCRRSLKASFGSSRPT